MATISDSLRLSIINTQNVSKSIASSQREITKTNISINNISKSISKTTKMRSDLDRISFTWDAKRREASRRREIEDEIEASKVSTNVSKAFTMGQSGSGGVLQRLLGFLGYMTAGWIIENLPTWIFIGKEFISRLYKAGKIIQNLRDNTWTVIVDFGELLKNVAKDFLQFDFSDQSDRVKNSFSDLNESMKSVNDELFGAYSLLLTPLSTSIDTGEQAPPLGQEAPNVLYPQVGGIHKKALDIIAGPESGGNYNAMNQGTDKNGNIVGSTMGGKTSKDIIGKNLTDMTIGEVIDRQNERKYPRNAKPDLGIHAAGKYQMIGNTLPGAMNSAGLKPSDKFSPENQDKMALALLQERGLAPWTSGGSRYSPKERAIIEQARRTPVTMIEPTQAAKPTPSITPTNTFTGLSLIPQTGSGGFVQGGSGSGNDKQYATHFHVDYINPTNDPSILARIRDVAFYAVKAMFARGSTVFFGNTKVFASKDDNKLKSEIYAEQQAHGARSSFAVDIQESNKSIQRTFPDQPGSKTKFPFAVGSVYYRGGYGREAEIIGTGGITVSHGAPGSSESKISGKPSVEIPKQKADLYPTVKSTKATAITPERKGPSVIIADNPTPPLDQQAVKSYSSQPKEQPQKINESDVLNNFIKQKLLLELVYV